MLESLTHQTRTDFEVVIVEDGSSIPCQDVVDRYKDRLAVRYYQKANSGPGQTRNYGVARAEGEYVLILDSDVVLPEGYVAAVERDLAARPTDAFGVPTGRMLPSPDAEGHQLCHDFLLYDRRYSRRKKKMDKFYPRSFNMGVRREVYQALEGFSAMRFGEDIDFSTRIFKGGYRCRLFPEAWVWHKRRTDLRKFFKQVHNSGIARINLMKRHPGTLKLVHLLPAVFTVGCALLLVLFLLAWSLGCPHSWGVLLPFLLFALIICADATRAENSLYVGILAVAASYVQLWGYGSGFVRAWWERCVLGRGEFEAFKKNFYK